MTVVLCIVYFLLGYWVLKRLKITQGFSTQALLGIWSIKVSVGFLFFFLFKSVYGNYFDALYAFHDVDNYYREQSLGNYIKYFFNGWTQFDFSKGLIHPTNTVALKDLGNQLYYRFLMISHALSLGTIYPMMILYNFLVIIGQFALVQFFRKSGVKSEGILAIVVFLIPSILFWTSGLQKDGFAYSLFGLLFYYLFQFVREKKSRTILWIVILALLLFLLRYYYLIAVLPAILLYWVQVQYGGRVYWASIVFFIVVLVVIGKLSPSLNLINYFNMKQFEFNQIIGASTIDSLRTDGSVFEFIQNIFRSLFRVLFMPYPFQFDKMVIQIAAFENVLLVFTCVLALLRLDRKAILKPENAMVFFVAIISLIFIGLIVSNVGSFVRYRSVFILFFYLPLLSNSTYFELDQKIKLFIYK